MRWREIKEDMYSLILVWKYVWIGKYICINKDKLYVYILKKIGV